MNRRETVLALIALGAAPLAAAVQQPGKVPRIGFLCSRPGPSSHTQAFEQGLRELGYVPGRNILIEYRFMPVDGRNPFPGFAAEFVGQGVDAILIGSPLAVDPARQATSRIPLVIAQSDDPVGSGIVASLARPGGNITGLSSMAPEMGVKQLELLHTVLPRLSRVAVLWNGANGATKHQLRALEAAAAQLRVTVQSLPVRGEPREFDQAFSALTKGGAQALMVLPDMMFFDHLEQLRALATRRRLPAIYGEREFVDAGGMMSYGTNYDDLFRRAASYVDKIVKGARPTDLPIQQPTKFELVINLKTAKVLGITIPQSVLLRADRVIE